MIIIYEIVNRIITKLKMYYTLLYSVRSNTRWYASLAV